MFRTTVIAITGSVGKTTAKECLAAILETEGPVARTLHNQNDRFGLPKTIRAMRPWHRFAVVELGTQEPGDMCHLARLLNPDLALVLCVAGTHTMNFGTLENTAAEKSVLLDFVRPNGLAVLNFDDHRVRHMAEGRTLRTRFFGTAFGCQFRAEAAESRWPERLRFQLVSNGQRIDVRTRLVGKHWVNSVLGALAVADACGIGLNKAARAVSRVQPFAARMQPVTLPNGAVMLRDEQNASVDTLEAMVRVLRDASATRRGIVFSDQSDTKKRPRKRMRRVGEWAAELCDFAVFVGEHAHHGVRAATAAGMDSSSCVAPASLADAAQWLKEFARPGDLVFLKGRGTDHLSRILFSQFGEIGCWKPNCKITRLCDYCSQLKPAFDVEETLTNAVD